MTEDFRITISFSTEKKLDCLEAGALFEHLIGKVFWSENSGMQSWEVVEINAENMDPHALVGGKTHRVESD